MTSEQIEDALKKRIPQQVFDIKFKTRSPIKGLFIKTPDYHELSRKNLWRIVSGMHLDEFRKTADVNLAKIFNGSEFTRLEVS